jgi:hypothetical protein
VGHQSGWKGLISSGFVPVTHSYPFDESLPVDPGERILRRVHPQNVSERQLKRRAFAPVPNDADGISVFRALFCRDGELVRTGKCNQDYYIAELLASDFFEIGLSITPKPVQDATGHCVVPELVFVKKEPGAQIELTERLMRAVRDVRGPIRWTLPSS